MLVNVLIYGSKKMIWREKERMLNPWVRDLCDVKGKVNERIDESVL